MKYSEQAHRVETKKGSISRQINPHFNLARKVVDNPHYQEAKLKLKTSDAERFFQSVELLSNSCFNWHIFDKYNEELISNDYIERFK